MSRQGYRYMKLALFLSLTLLSASAATAQDSVVGILALPEIFGDGPCHDFTPEEVPLYAVMGAEQAYAVIRVDNYWTFPDAGGCEGLSVKVHKANGQSISTLPTAEFDYEAPGVIVLDKRDDWFKVRLADGAAWVQASDHNAYYPLETLLLDGLTYIAATPGSQMFKRPAGSHSIAMAENGASVHVLEVVTVGKQLWLHIQALSHSMCDSIDEPSVSSQGWVRAHDASGRPTVWFYSRGC